MATSNDTTQLVNHVTLDVGSLGSRLSWADTTLVRQTCEFYFEGQEGRIKQASGNIFKYLVVVQNRGNIWDRFQLYMDPSNPEYDNCSNPLTYGYKDST